MPESANKCALCLNPKIIYKKTYGIKKITALCFNAWQKSSFKSDKNALVIPHPGHGKPSKSKNTHEILK